jgi:folylpolyglutamate synthase/dihydropteroate synthase
VTRAEPVRSLSPSEVATAIRAAAPRVPVQVVPNPHLAVRAAREKLGDEDLLCVSGSIYLAGIARRVLCGDGSNDRVSVSRRSGDA